MSWPLVTMDMIKAMGESEKISITIKTLRENTSSIDSELQLIANIAKELSILFDEIRSIKK